MIEVERVSKFFSVRYALDGVSLAVAPGEICGLIGPNGAGKTTLLRILATVLRPTEGRIEIAGFTLPVEADRVRRRIGYMPDSFSTYEELRVDAFLEVFAHMYEIPRAEIDRTVRDILTLVDLMGLRHAPIADLSLGVRQRLSLARALLHNPEVLLLDEPISGLDPRARVEMRALLRELGRMGKAILISSHVLADIAGICDRLLVLENGKRTFFGTFDELENLIAPERRVEIAVAERGEDAERFLARQRWAQEVRRLNGSGMEVVLTSGTVPLEEISGALCSAGFRITRFAEKQLDLEEAFLRFTKGDVS